MVDAGRRKECATWCKERSRGLFGSVGPGSGEIGRDGGRDDGMTLL